VLGVDCADYYIAVNYLWRIAIEIIEGDIDLMEIGNFYNRQSEDCNHKKTQVTLRDTCQLKAFFCIFVIVQLSIRPWNQH
jgi:hypothetical protein